MFQVEAGRSTVQPVAPEPAPATFGPEASSVVADHLDALLGEQLLPVRLREGTEDEPYLLAVDAAGQPVVVEVVPVLDEAACTRALRHAGRAARLTTQELGQAYRGGPARFAEHLARFRETIPASALLTPSVRGGARLLLVCSEVTEAMTDVAEFLLQPGWQVEILQVGVVHDAEGRRIVDVSPLVRTAQVRRSPAPAAPPAAAPPSAHRPPAAQDHRPPGPQDHRPPAPPPTRRPTLRRDATDRQPVISAVPRVPEVVPPPFAAAVVTHPPERRVPDGGPRTRELDPVPPAPPVAPERPVAGAAARAPVTPEPPRVAAPGPVPDGRLAALAAEIGEPMALVWARRRRGVSYEALLHPDGVIELADGSRHTDPDTAATVVSGSQVPVDGWSVWRLEGDGPSLREALEL